MKKIALSLAVLFSVALVACGNKETKAADSDSVVMDSAVEMVDTAAADTVAADTAAPAADTVKA